MSYANNLKLAYGIPDSYHHYELAFFLDTEQDCIVTKKVDGIPDPHKRNFPLRAAVGKASRLSIVVSLSSTTLKAVFG